MAKKKSLKERMAERLSASDINYLIKNAEKYTIGFLTTKLGKSVKLIEKELRKQGIKPLEAAIAAPEPVIEEKIEIVPQVEPPATKPQTNQFREFIKNNAASMTVRELMEQTGLTQTSIVKHLKKLGITAKPGRNFFSAQEVEYLKANAGKKPVSEIAREMGRLHKTIENKILTLGLSTRLIDSKRSNYVSEDQIEYIKKYSSTKLGSEIAKELNLRATLVRKIRRDLNLEQVIKRAVFTKEDLEFIENNYRLLTKREMAYYLKKTASAIAYQMDIHNWVLTTEETKQLKSRWTKENISPPLKWTPAEEAFIKHNFGKIPYSEISARLKSKTRNQVVKIARTLGLVVKPEHMSTFNRMNGHKGNEVLREKKQKAKS